MKRFFLLFIASVLIGLVFFALLHWLFGISQADATWYAATAALAGLGAEYLGPLIGKIDITRHESIAQRVRRNLKHFRNRVEE
jgi:hypothetical protein